MSWMFGNDEDNNPRQPDYRPPRGSDSDSSSSKGCAVLALVLAGGIMAIVAGVFGALAALLDGMMG